ncbi:hypothetical protein Q3G72_023512 [Acer saccharum]|nr:hypothetical protein Q3G72_023512 [Acer saccharum]
MEKEKEIISDFFIDDVYFFALLDDFEEKIDDQEEELDSKYAEELQFQEALLASIITSQISTHSTQMTTTTTTTNTIQASLQPEPLTVMIITPSPSCESSGSQTTFCEICVEIKQSDEMFTTESCNHSYCCECISKHVSTKIQDSAKVMITCPGVNCKSVLEIDACREVIPKEMIGLWEEALCEELIDESERFYCPYKDCSALLLNDCKEEVIVVEAECPVCHRLFCAQCCVPWHSGVECEEFQRLNEDERGREDLMVVELAKDNKWGRCPHCKFYVERTQGCPHITCRCSYQFCYGCGSEWTDTHGGCTRD